MKIRGILAAGTGAAALLNTSVAGAQTPPIAVQGELRAFGGREATTYYSGQAEYGALVLRAVGARRRIYERPGDATLLHGGADYEIAARHTFPPGVEGQIGVALSDTAEHHYQGHLTLRARWERPYGERVTFAVEPRAVVGNGGTLVGIGLGGTVKLTDALALVGDVTPIVSGDNNRDFRSGDSKRTTLYSIGLQATPLRHPDLSVTIGATNALGVTTGTSLSSSLSGSALTLKVRLSR